MLKKINYWGLKSAHDPNFELFKWLTNINKCKKNKHLTILLNFINYEY